MINGNYPIQRTERNKGLKKNEQRLRDQQGMPTYMQWESKKNRRGRERIEKLFEKVMAKIFANMMKNPSGKYNSEKCICT